MGVNLIAVALIIPVIAAIQLVLGRSLYTNRSASYVGAAAMAASFAALVGAWALRDDGERWAGLIDVVWIETLGARFHLGLDGISWPLALMAALLAILACLSLGDNPPVGSTPTLVALVLVISSASIGVFAALDLLLFFVFFEFALIPMWFVIAWWGDPSDDRGRRYAATRFLLFTVFGSALMLAGFALVAVRGDTLQITELSGIALSSPYMVFAAVLIALGFAVKTPLVPFHTWLPDAHSKAPTVGSVLLAGVFLKLGTYGLVRVNVEMMPAATATFAPYLGVAGVVGIIYSALACLRQDDLKRLIAYSSIGHMGFVVLGLSTMTDLGIAAAIFGSVAHGLITGLLFFNAGWLKSRYGTVSLRAMGRGLYSRAPWLAVIFVFGAIASLGLPGLAGFWGEMLALRSVYEVGPVLASELAWTLLGVGAIGVVLATAYFVRAIRRLCQGEPTSVDVDRDVSATESVIAGVLVASIVALGVAPGLLMGALEPTVILITGGAR